MDDNIEVALDDRPDVAMKESFIYGWRWFLGAVSYINGTSGEKIER
jgi:hypothetical protein